MQNETAIGNQASFIVPALCPAPAFERPEFRFHPSNRMCIANHLQQDLLVFRAYYIARGPGTPSIAGAPLQSTAFRHHGV